MAAVKISEQQRADFMNIFNADTIKSQQADPNEVTLPSGQKQVWSNEESLTSREYEPHLLPPHSNAV